MFSIYLRFFSSKFSTSVCLDGDSNYSKHRLDSSIGYLERPWFHVAVKVTLRTAVFGVMLTCSSFCVHIVDYIKPRYLVILRASRTEICFVHPRFILDVELVGVFCRENVNMGPDCIKKTY